MQKCKSRPQAQNPITGRYFKYCSNACAAPRTLPGLPTGSNVGNSPGTGAGANTDLNQFLSCDVSLYFRIAVGKSLNKLSSKALQEKAKVCRGRHCTSLLWQDVCESCEKQGACGREHICTNDPHQAQEPQVQFCESHQHHCFGKYRISLDEHRFPQHQRWTHAEKEECNRSGEFSQQIFRLPEHTSGSDL